MSFTPASTASSAGRLRVQVAGASAVTRWVCCLEEIEPQPRGVFATLRSFVRVRRTITHNRLARADFVEGSLVYWTAARDQPSAYYTAKKRRRTPVNWCYRSMRL